MLFVVEADAKVTGKLDTTNANESTAARAFPLNFFILFVLLKIVRCAFACAMRILTYLLAEGCNSPG
jgi:hypothetical protein